VRHRNRLAALLAARERLRISSLVGLERVYLPLLFAMGFFSLAAQSLLFREHLIAANGNELSITAFLASWMLAIAVGALAARFVAHLLSGALTWLLTLYPVALFAQVVLTWSLRDLAGAPDGTLLPISDLLVWSIPACFPVSFLTGFLFTVASHVLGSQPGERSLRAVSRAYGAEAAGSLVAGIVITAALLADVPVSHLLVGLASVMQLSSALFAFLRAATIPVFWHVSLLVACIVAWIFGGADWLQERREAALPLPAAYSVVESADTPYLNVAIASSRLADASPSESDAPPGGQQQEPGRPSDVVQQAHSERPAMSASARAVFLDGELALALDDRLSSVTRAATLYAMKPDMTNVLILGFGAEGLIREILRGPVGSVTYVGADARFLEIVKPHLPADVAQSLADPRVSIVYSEPRRFLGRKDVGPFDVVVLNAQDPRTAQASRFFTAEFYSLVAGELSEGGLFSTEISLTENVLQSATLEYARAVYSTLSVTFPEVAFTAGERMTLFAGASAGVVTSDPNELSERFRAVSGALPEFPPAAFATLFEQERIAERREALAIAGVAGISHDHAPAVYLLNLLSQHGAPELLPWIEGARRRGAWIFLSAVAALAATVLLARVGRRRSLSATLVGAPGGDTSALAEPGGGIPAPALRSGPSRGNPALTLFVAGFAGMAGQIVIVLGYQAIFGSLFAEFGMLSALFMVGLFIGSFFMGRSKGMGPGGAFPALWLAAVLVLVWLLLGGGAHSGSAMHLRWLYLAASMALGLFAGWCLSMSAEELSRSGASARAAGAMLEGLDHLGAVAGAVLGGLLFVPLFGLGPAALLTAALAAVVGVVRVVGGGEGTSAWGSQGGSPWPGGAPWKHTGRSDAPSGLKGVEGPVVLFLLLFLLFAGMGSGNPVPGFPPRPAQAESGGGGTGSQVSALVTWFPPGGGTGREGGPISSWSVCPEVAAYGGPMELLVDLDESGRVEHVELGRHYETPEYVFGIEDWFDTFRMKDGAALEYDAADNPDGVDALTGATVTGKAAVEIIRRVGAKERPPWSSVSSPPSGGSTPSEARGEEGLAGSAWLVPIVLAVLALALYLRPSWKLRRVLLVLSVGAGGVWLNNQLAMDSVVRAIGGELPPESNLLLWAALGAAVLVFLLAGALFCGSLCPFGALSDLLSQIGLGWRVAPLVDRRLRKVKYVLAAVLVGGFAVTGARWLFFGDLLSFAFLRRWDVIGVSLLLVALLASLVWWRPWCRYVCPLGAIMSVGDRFAVLDRLGLAPRRISARCHLGVQAGEDWDCIRCNRCVELPLPRQRLLGGPPQRFGQQVGIDSPCAGSDGRWWGGVGRIGPAAVVLVVAAIVALGTARVVSGVSGLPRGTSAGSGEGTSAGSGDGTSAGSGDGTSAGSGDGTSAWGSQGGSPWPSGAPGMHMGRSDAPSGLKGVDGSGLMRKDDKLYEMQRPVDPDDFKRRIREGTLSGTEAEHYVPVP